MSSSDIYTYQVFWSEEDGAFVATVAEFALLSWIDERGPLEAITGLRNLVQESIDDLVEDGNPVPQPNKKFHELREPALV